MSDDTRLFTGFPAFDGKAVRLVFNGSRLPSDAAVPLLARSNGGLALPNA
jgi:hypothetical protein